MKKLLYGTAFLIFWIALGLTVVRAQETGGPKMVIKEKVSDFKKVKQGEIVEHSFKVLNRGDQPLEIKKVKPG